MPHSGQDHRGPPLGPSAAWLLTGLLCLWAVSGPAQPAWADQPRGPSLAVLPFEIDDLSGEAGPAIRHDAKLAALTSSLRRGIAARTAYRVIPGALVDQAVAEADLGTYLRSCNGCEFRLAKALGAERVLVGWVIKVSSLVLSLRIQVKQLSDRRLIYARAFDFRGDNQTAWQRAADFAVRALTRAEHDKIF